MLKRRDSSTTDDVQKKTGDTVETVILSNASLL